MGTRNIYHGDHSIVAKGGTLTLEGDNVTIVGSPTFTDATLTEATITTLNTNNIDADGGALTLDGSTYGVTITTSTGNIILQTTGVDGDISILSNDDLSITAGDNITFYASGRMDISGAEYTYVKGDGGSAFLLINSTGLFLTNASQSGGSFHLLPDSDVLIASDNQGDGQYSQVLRVQSEWDDNQADGMAVILEPATLDTTNVFIRFSKNGDVTNTAGRIRGPASSSAVAFQADGSDGGGAVNGTGDVVYASGASDFGEWIEVGDIDEWNLPQKHLDTITPDNPSIGLPEGWVCYVRGQKFFKEGPGTPMLVTRSALLVGNEYDRENYCGEIFSFSGQISVIVKGKVDSGDLLIPSGAHYCTAISPENITFDQYKKVIGTAWTDFAGGEEYGRVKVAIGVKNTY